MGPRRLLPPCLYGPRHYADSPDAALHSDRYRFIISKVRGPNGVDGVQLGEIKIWGDTHDDATGVTTSGELHVSQISNPGGCGGTIEAEQCGMPFTAYNQLVDGLIDGDGDADVDPVVDQICQSTNYQRCKWFDSAFDPEGSVSGRSVIEVRLSELALLTRYEFFTAVDVEKRDPVSWTVQKQRQDGV